MHRLAKSVFYSFHYERDVHRAQLIRNIDALEGQSLLSSQAWEELRKGDLGIRDWIQAQMAYKKAVIILIGQQTTGRQGVNYEISKAWASHEPPLGARVHGLSSMGTVDRPGCSPFNSVSGIQLLDPTVKDAWGTLESKATDQELTENLEFWSSRGVTRS